MRPGGGAAGIAAGMLALIAWGCSSSSVPQDTASGEAEAKKAGERESLMRGMRLRQIEQGKLEVILEAREAWIARKGRLLNAREVKATYFGRDAKPAVLRADFARYDLDRSFLKAWGDVRVQAEDMMLETASMVWDGVEGRASGDSRVRITKGENVTTGTGFEWDPALEKVIIREVEASIDRPQELAPLVNGLEGQ